MTNLFISHKHSDHAIARVLAQFATDRGLGNVRVHLSSDSAFDGPRFGPGLNARLTETLTTTDVLILIYTADDKDWSYCMWECGVATSAETNLIVFQCSDDYPKLFAADLRVNARDIEHVRRFTKQFLTDDRFFPRRGAALAPNTQPSTLENASQELFAKLESVLPKDNSGPVQQWAAWPYLRVEVPMAEIERIGKADEDERRRLWQQVVAEQGVVVEEARVAAIFGLTGLAPRHPLKELLTTWRERAPGADTAWFDSCCEQIMTGAQRQFPFIRRAPLRKAGRETEFTPVLSRTRRLPFAGVMQFDLYFYDLSNPSETLVTSRMLEAGEFFCKNLGEVSPESVGLKELVLELDKLGWGRLPLLSAAGHPLFIVHRSMIEQFMLQRVLYSAGGKAVEELTLADLLGDPKMKQTFENTLVVVPKSATLAEARDAMRKTRNCLDVFVTERGGRDEPVLGWLSSVRINR